MRTVIFSKKYIKQEFESIPNADKRHGMFGNTQHTICGLANEICEEKEGIVTCPGCIEIIIRYKKLVPGTDYKKLK